MEDVTNILSLKDLNRRERMLANKGVGVTEQMWEYHETIRHLYQRITNLEHDIEERRSRLLQCTEGECWFHR